MSAKADAIFPESDRVLWICLTLSGSLAGAVAIKLGIAFGAGDPRAARRIAGVGSSIALGVLAAVAVAVASFPRGLALIFSEDPQIVDGFVQIRFSLAAMVVAMNMVVFLEKIVMATGQPKFMLALNLVGSWGGQVPAVWLFTHFAKELAMTPLQAICWGVTVGYGILAVAFFILIARSNFAKHVEEARSRSEM